jgi:hypothetical protein
MDTTEAILRTLIQEYGPALHLPAGDNQIAAYIARETGLAQGTILGLLNGSTKRMNQNTRTKLANFFNRAAVPQIQPLQLSSSSLAEFNSKRTGSGVIPLTIPADYHKKVRAVEKWLCGIHIVYRYSLDFIDTGDVAREVLHIWNNGKFLEFKMSFINQTGTDRTPVFYFQGPILLIGRSVLLFGTNIGVNTAEREHDRIRVIVIDHDNAGGDTHDCKIGLMTSTRPRRDHAPCTASTILIRTQWSVEDSAIEELVRTTTAIRPLDDTIKCDFGAANGPLIRLFLDNRPHGYELDPELEQYLIAVGPDPERVLRLDTERFATRMRRVLAHVMSNDEICAPFKENWLSCMSERMPPADESAEDR